MQVVLQAEVRIAHAERLLRRRRRSVEDDDERRIEVQLEMVRQAVIRPYVNGVLPEVRLLTPLQPVVFIEHFDMRGAARRDVRVIGREWGLCGDGCRPHRQQYDECPWT